MRATGRYTSALRKRVHYGYDRCGECGATLAKHVPAYAGYNATGAEIYVGECCKASISELASYVYWWFTSYKRPTATTVMWRYMDFSAFVALLKDKALHFARADQFDDPFEGARGLAARKPEWKAYCLDYFRDMVRSLPGNAEKPSDERIEQQAEELFQDFDTMGEREIKSTFVTCWHANDGESEALWRLYAPRLSGGICIRTEFGALDEALDDSFDIRFGHVQYIDFAKRFAGTYDRVFWKRASLSHEAEVRGVIYRDWFKPSDDLGLLVPIDLSRAINAVITSPFAPRWFDGVVRETMQRFGLNAPVTPSELSAQPFI